MLNQKFLRILTLTVVVIGMQAAANFAQSICDNFVNTCNVPGSLNTYTISDSLLGMTGQAGEPVAHTFYTTAQNPLTTTWYHWTPQVNGIFQVDTRGTNPNAIAPLYITPYVIDTTVAVYTGSTLTTLVRKAESDNWLANTITSNCLVNRPVGESLNSSCLRFLVTAGTTYHFQVDKLSETDPNNNNLLLNVSMLSPTAANGSVSGRVTDAAGQGLSRVSVSLTDMDGNVQTARTSTFGNYRFDNVTVGQSYVLQAASKRYQFANNPRILNVVNSVADENFVGLEN